MLLELHDIDRSLRAAGITVEVSDKRIQPYPNRAALEVRISPEGLIVGLSLLRKERLEAIRKFECSTGGLRESTPGFNVDPLFRLKSESAVNELKKLLKQAKKTTALQPEEREKLKHLVDTHGEPNWDFSEKSKIHLCLGKAAHVLRKELAGAEDPHLRPLLELLSRSEALSVSILHQRLAEALLKVLVMGNGEIRAEDGLRMLFSGQGPTSAKNSSNQSFSLILELADWNDLGEYPANHEAVWRAVNQRLTTGKAPKPSQSTSRPNAALEARKAGIFGEPIGEPLGTMPERNLPRLGKVKIFSLADIPCQRRYGLIESGACPVAPEIQARLSSALQWITDKARENQTWADVSSSCGYNKQSAILVAYTDKMPDIPVALTRFFVPEDDEDEDETSNHSSESRFGSSTESVVQTLRGMVSENPNIAVSVLVIAKADPARTKLLYSKQFAVKRLIDAADEWQAAARNHPPIRIRIFDSKRNPRWTSPWAPFPDSVVRVINTCWESNGEKPKRVSDARLGLGLALLLDTGPSLRDAAREALRPLVRNVTPIVLALARARIEGRVFAVPKGFQDIPLLAPATLGLVLAKAGHEKGAYMQSNCYLIGRLLSLADEFHRDYCNRERKGQPLPPLIGNSLMPTALENPVQGLARLAERMALYLSVPSGTLPETAAEIERAIDKNARRADQTHRDLSRRAAEIERAIDKNALPSRCGDEEKAQMLLGYLAGTELTNEPQPASSDTREENKK